MVSELADGFPYGNPKAFLLVDSRWTKRDLQYELPLAPTQSMVELSWTGKSPSPFKVQSIDQSASLEHRPGVFSRNLLVENAQTTDCFQRTVVSGLDPASDSIAV